MKTCAQVFVLCFRWKMPFVFEYMVSGNLVLNSYKIFLL